jgi:hypothetical protein
MSNVRVFINVSHLFMIRDLSCRISYGARPSINGTTRKYNILTRAEFREERVERGLSFIQVEG